MTTPYSGQPGQPEQPEQPGQDPAQSQGNAAAGGFPQTPGVPSGDAPYGGYQQPTGAPQNQGYPPAGGYQQQQYGAPGAPQYGAPGAPQFGAPGAPGAPQYGAPGFPQAQPPKKSKSGLIIGAISAVVILLIVAAVGAYFALRGSSEGETVDTTAIGSCITVTGSMVKAETAPIDCDDTATPSYIVGAKLASQEACKSASYSAYIYEYGTGSSDEVLCLVPNYQVGTCYEESTMSVELTTVACTETSSMITARYKITERVDSANVPNCTDPEKLKVFTFDILTEPARQIGVCAEILGDYAWQ